MQFRFSAILLDLDGTLVDSAPELAAAVNGTLESLGRRTLSVEEVRGMIGNGLPALTLAALAATGGAPDAEATEDIICRVRTLYDRQPPPRVFDGVRETLTDWHQSGISLIVCTNKPEGSARRLMAELGLDRLIADLAGGDSYPVRKPHPGHLLRPLERLGLDPKLAVMVGDSHIDADAARDAGIPFIAVSYGYAGQRRGEMEAVSTVDRFADVTGAIAQLAERRGLAFPSPPPEV
ncbi:MAG: HAD-IA family hydrolase [Alphaproteobacteria bacterium]|nr:HAD-IA family hydrolase [Alphaproteobacteria bacterium]